MAGEAVKMSTETKGKAIDAALANIEKKFGKGSIMRSANDPHEEVGSISTNCLSLDAAIGVGGMPRGRIIEVYGPESSGKTTLALQVVAQAQKMGGVAAYIDAEHAMDPEYAEKLGVDIDDMLISQPDSGEQALDIAETLVRSASVDVIVVDSVAALVPRAEIDGDMGDSHMGLQARLMSQALRKMTSIISNSNTCFIFINQLRDKIGVMFGSPETTTGGKALKFYASVRIDIRRIGAIKEGDKMVGNRTRVKVVKNKVAPPFRETEFDIMYGEGISREGDLLDLAVNHNVVEKSGAWFSYSGERLGQGRENSKNTLKENPELLERIEREVKVKLGMIACGDTVAEAPKSKKRRKFHKNSKKSSRAFERSNWRPFSYQFSSR
jgi:recombination protein RecA